MLVMFCELFQEACGETKNLRHAVIEGGKGRAPGWFGGLFQQINLSLYSQCVTCATREKMYIRQMTFDASNVIAYIKETISLVHIFTAFDHMPG